MSRKSFLVFFVSIICFLSVFRSEKIISNAVEAQNQSARLSLEISNSQESFLQGEPVLIDLKLSNQTNQSISWRGRLGSISHTTFVTTNDAGVQSRFDGNKYMTGSYVLLSRIMQPEEQFQKASILGEDLVEELFPSPGQYNLQTEFVYDGNAEGERRIKILSNSIPINIVEPQGIDKQARKHIKEKIKGYKLKTREDTRALAKLKQEFVDKYRNSVYAKYIIFDLGITYETIGEDAKALRELCSIYDEKFYYFEDIEKIVLRIDGRVNPVVWGPGLPIPVLKHPCTGKVIH